MESNQCLFFRESNNCSNIAANEHIIQQGLGGSLSSSDIICANCNNLFSRNLDAELTKLYEPIIKILSPFISGRLKHRKKKTKLSYGSEEYGIEYVSGTANLTEIVKKHSSNGHLQKVIAPNSYPREKLQDIAKSERVETKTFIKVPFTELFPNAREKVCLNITPVVIRAILLDILELAHYVSVTQNFINIAKHRCLNQLRLWTRAGLSSSRFPPKDILFAFAPVSDLLDPLFKASTFSHRVVICFDHKSKALILVAQFVNTMPWVFIFENILLHSCPLSILYQKALIDGDDQLLTYENRAVFDIRNIQRRKFSTTTRHAIQFAKTKWSLEYRTQNARAHYEADLRNDIVIREKLAYYTNNSQSGTSAPIDAIVKLIENRYEGSQYLKDILKTTKKIVFEQWSNCVNEKNQQVSLYRKCLKKIKSTFGYPCIYGENQSHDSEND